MRTATTSSLPGPVALVALVAAALPAQVEPVPAAPVPAEPAALAAARDAVRARLIADRVAERGLEAFLDDAMRAAAASRDPAARYTWLEQRVEAAVLAGRPAVACAAVDELGRWFAIDVPARLLGLLDELAEREGGAAAAVALTAMARVRQLARTGGGAAATRLLPIARRAAGASGDRWLAQAVTGLSAELRDLAAGRERWVAAGGDAPGNAARLFEQLCVDPAGLTELRLGELRGELGVAIDAAEAQRSLSTVGAERLLGLAPRARSAFARRALLRTAGEQLATQCLVGGSLEVIARQLATVTGALADQDGLTRLRFGDDDALQQLVISNGKWRVEGGLLLGAADGANNFATHRHAFRRIRSVVLRAGIRSPAGLNLRMAIGDLNVLWNWEVEDSNHAWFDDRRFAAGPRALTAGTEHVIGVYTVRDRIAVLVDDRLWFALDGELAGSVSVYPALGSEICVREILIDGDLEATPPLAGPLLDLK